MPCHVDPIEPKDNEIDTIIEVTNGKIKIQNVGDDFYGKYPTVKELVTKAREKKKTFHYKVQGSLFVIVSPCPKGC